MRQHETAIAEFERATVLNPNLNNFVFGWYLVVAGEPARAVKTLKAHIRLDPFYSPFASWWLGSVYYDGDPSFSTHLSAGREFAGRFYGETLALTPWTTLMKLPQSSPQAG